MRKTKIICTLGPSSSDEDTLREMLVSGMNIARLNFSHGTHENHKLLIDTFRKVRDSLNLPAAVMLDTKGPEIRLGVFENKSVFLENGSYFTLTSDDILGNEERVSVSYKDLPSQVFPGNKILIDDGNILLEVSEIKNHDVICKVLVGGKISDRKGVNVPNVHLDFPYLSEQDKSDLIFGVEQDVDFIAASFVRSKEDVISIRDFLNYHGGNEIKIISKIENIEGVNNFDEILHYSDGIMVARGDMGVEVEFERLPGLQKKFIKKCYQAGKMVITATQMLESMIHNNTPTRAEITDVANAVFDGTSAIMLSGESAVGEHPALVVKVMAKIALQAEKDAFDMDIYNGIKYENDINDTTNAICDAACTTARDVNASAIFAVTKTGHTARAVSKFRPREIIIASTPEYKAYHQLSLSWGVYPIKALYQTDINVLFNHSINIAKKLGYVKNNDRVVITSGSDNITDILKVMTVEDSQ
ncbi:MAG: pyruvate kinase [Bacillota bacterium]|nr:pyruvate kinase [Bacillota bacterium]